ncbi:MAG: MmcQ/YjbR family DNA-binding protein [Rhodospirillaceae bacterium]
MMTPKRFNAFCAKLPCALHVVQWGDADVWKVGGTVSDAEGSKLHAKVFAIGAWHHGELAGITFKVSDIAYEVLKDMQGLRPAPYLASRGMTWIQMHADPGLSDRELKRHLEQAHALVARNLPKRVRGALGPKLGGFANACRDRCRRRRERRRAINRR